MIAAIAIELIGIIVCSVGIGIELATKGVHGAIIITSGIFLSAVGGFLMNKIIKARRCHE